MAERYLAGEQVVVVSRQSARFTSCGPSRRIPTIYVSCQYWPSPAHIHRWQPGGRLDLYTYRRWARCNLSDRWRDLRLAAPQSRASAQRAFSRIAGSRITPTCIAGDYVVHVDHGIGRFDGLVRRTVDSVEREYLCVEYAEEAQLFVPVHQADRLTRYVGPTTARPTPAAWAAQNGAVSKRTSKKLCRKWRRSARAVCQAQCGRRATPFRPDTPWQEELEASFPYIETDDQLRVLAEVKHDMEDPAARWTA